MRHRSLIEVAKSRNLNTAPTILRTNRPNAAPLTDRGCEIAKRELASPYSRQVGKIGTDEWAGTPPCSHPPPYSKQLGEIPTFQIKKILENSLDVVSEDYQGRRGSLPFTYMSSEIVESELSLASEARSSAQLTFLHLPKMHEFQASV
jgi:hypothetical protein